VGESTHDASTEPAGIRLFFVLARSAAGDFRRRVPEIPQWIPGIDGPRYSTRQRDMFGQPRSASRAHAVVLSL
jgi:hypothetical protein